MTVACSHWANNDGVRLHYLDPGDGGPHGDGSGATLPIVFVPGLSDHAAEYSWLLDAWSPRRTVIVDLRGRGASDAPETGYRPDDHADDLAAVLADCGLCRVVLVTFSRGTAYALTWALRNPGAVAGLVVGDYQAKHIRLPPEFPDYWMNSSWRGRPMTQIMSRHVINGITRDSVDEPLWDHLRTVPYPIMLIRAARGILDETAVMRWRTAVPSLRLEMFEASGHDLFKREGDRFARAVREFAELADQPCPS